MCRAYNLERIGYGVSVFGHVIILIHEGNAEALIGHDGGEAAGSRATVGKEAMRRTVARTKDGRGRRE